jgi:hypothetical protein
MHGKLPQLSRRLLSRLGSEVVAASAAYEFGVPLAGAKRSVPNIALSEVDLLSTLRFAQLQPLRQLAIQQR